MTRNERRRIHRPQPLGLIPLALLMLLRHLGSTLCLITALPLHTFSRLPGLQNPRFAHQAIGTGTRLGLLLPTRRRRYIDS
ncbi:MAG: hypothetical protein PHI25_13690 [Zoogloea sp.]|nr:hypothetical protein [Zoogloea sp.]